MSQRISRGDARSKHGGLKGWLLSLVDVPEGTTVRVKDGGSYGNRYFIYELPNGEEVKVSGYCSQSPAATYSVSTFNIQEMIDEAVDND